jgi:hypothetical protein
MSAVRLPRIEAVYGLSRRLAGTAGPGSTLRSRMAGAPNDRSYQGHADNCRSGGPRRRFRSLATGLVWLWRPMNTRPATPTT